MQLLEAGHYSLQENVDRHKGRVRVECKEQVSKSWRIRRCRHERASSRSAWNMQSTNGRETLTTHSNHALHGEQAAGHTEAVDLRFCRSLPESKLQTTAARSLRAGETTGYSLGRWPVL